MNNSKILVIDDEETIREGLAKLLKLDGYEVLTAVDGPHGLEAFDRFDPNIVLTDIKMPHMDGIEVLKRIREKSQQTGVILITGHGDRDLAIRALRDGAFDFFNKPVDFDKLSHLIKRKLEAQELDRERERLQVQLFQSSKLATIGTLAGGVAYELNSPLAVVVAYVDEVRAMIEDRQVGSKKVEELAANLGMIGKSAARMQAIVKHLLTYSRQSDALDFRDINLNDAISNAFMFFHKSFQKGMISEVFSLAEDLPHVWGDLGKLESVFVSLFTNSRDAFETITDKREKCVTISTSRHSNGGVMVVYKDNAGGMSAEIVQKIFEPFLGTKKAGKGAGVGMAVTNGVVGAHKGTIALESEMGQGTQFTLTFPAYQQGGTSE
ncbi:response regulator [Bdellovibrionota bacterium FG-2]